MAITYRRIKGSSLTNNELDDNFEYLESSLNTVNGELTNLQGTILTDLEAQITLKLAQKQPLSPKLTALSDNQNAGFISMSGNIVNARTLTQGNGINITNGGGINGNPLIEINNIVSTENNIQTISNKTISGSANTLINIPLSTAVTGILSINNGGTGASDGDAARVNISAMAQPGSDGFAVRLGQSAEARTIRVSGSGLSIVNGSGIIGDPTISSNATSTNTNNTIVYRDADGNFSANTISASLIGNVVGNASSVTNGLYSTGSYNNPTWLTGLAGSKVTNIPNASLQNNSITINGVITPLGSTINIPIPTLEPSSESNVANTLVKRNANGGFNAGTINANLVGNVTGNVVGTASNNVNRTGDTMTGSLVLAKDPSVPLEAATKQYVDKNMLQIVNGSMALSNTKLSDVVNPPVGLTIANLKGFLPAIGSMSVSSSSVVPTQVNVIIALDTSGSASPYQTQFKAISDMIVTKYSEAGINSFCLVNASNGGISKYAWATTTNALNGFNKTQTWVSSNLLSSIIASRPYLNGQTVMYFITDATHGLSNFYSLSYSNFVTYLNTNKIISYGLTSSSISGNLMTEVDKYSYDGITSKTLPGLRISTGSEIPVYATPKPTFSQGSISWAVQGNQIVVSLTPDTEAKNVSVNWLAIWG